LGFWGEIKLMNTDTGKVEANIDLHDPYGDKTDTSIDELTLLPDGTLVSFSGVSIGFCDWKAHAGHVIPMNASSHFVLLSGSRLVLLPGRGGIGVWNLRDQKPETLLPGDPDAGPENDLALLPDGQIATTSQQGVLALWNLETGKKKILRTADHMWDRYSNLFPLPDGRLVALGGESIEVWSVSRDRPDVVQTVARRKEMADPLLLADGRLLVATDDSGILLWNPQTKRPEAILEGHTKSPRHFVLLGDNRLASAGEDRTIRIWKIPANGGR
jgi:WD40 repeat protein